MYTLSFIVSTKNRLPYLKILFEEFFRDMPADEELVVVDGGSNDGSQEFLEKLQQEGRIHQYISETDRNQAEGWNKAMLMARGVLIKKVMDDDVFSIRGIRECKAYLLVNPSAHICIANSLHSNLPTPDKIVRASRLNQYQQWKAGEIPCFTFSDADMIIRKSALAITGLYDTQFVMIDWEFSLRCSFLKVSMVYYTGNLCLSVYAPGNISSAATNEVKKREDRIGRLKYGYPGDNAETSWLSKLKLAVWRLRKNWFATAIASNSIALPSEREIREIYRKWYTEINTDDSASNTFIT